MPGWDAIDRAVDRLYPGVEPHHWGTIKRWHQGGPDPLDGVSAYASDKRPPHWHYVSYGLSEPYAKESPDADTSGFGIELTFRLARPPGTTHDDAPVWVFSFLQNIARMVFETRNVFYPGHYMELFSPIREGSDTEIQAITFADDPELPAVDTPHGGSASCRSSG